MTHPQTAALQALLERVEAGTIVNNGYEDATRFADMCQTVFPDDVRTLWLSAWKAYHGSLDAAKALHEAVLPGWDFWIWRINQGDYCVDVVNGDEPEVCARSAANPARAWLIAILRALIADTEGR